MASRDRLQDMPECQRKFTEHLVEPRLTFTGRGSRDPPEPPHPDPLSLPAKAQKGKHNFVTHSEKDPNCEIHKCAKVRRAASRRTSQSHVHRATKFGEIITADHKVLNEEGKSWNNHKCAVAVQDLATQWIEKFPM